MVTCPACGSNSTVVEITDHDSKDREFICTNKICRCKFAIHRFGEPEEILETLIRDVSILRSDLNYLQRRFADIHGLRESIK
jgi:hypothetical protein